jgi:hypothetical protein
MVCGGTTLMKSLDSVLCTNSALRIQVLENTEVLLRNGLGECITPHSIQQRQDIMTLTQDILNHVDKGPEGLEESERLALVQAAEKLTVALENPFVKSLRLFTVCCPPLSCSLIS